MTTRYYTATSLDGFLADADNSLEWLFPVETGRDHREQFAEFFADVGAMAMGATTYEWVLEHEQALDKPEKWREWYADTPCWVFTHRDLPPVPGAALFFVQGDVAPVHAEMSAAAGDRDIWLVGGGELVGRFADAGLLEEIMLSVAPVTLGTGAPLLPRRLTSTELRLTDVAQDGQFATLTYRLTGQDRTPSAGR